ncbi:MAG: hypothetical protein Q4G47_04770 [Lachnospiraceae bacterium]|nr:hypothetical protein [Lachnospiraceae bacterium]
MIKILKAVLFATGLFISVHYMTGVLRVRSQETLSDSYYALADDGCDVLFVGNSLIMNAVYPMQLYEEYGITGYNLGSGGQSLMESRALIEEGIARFHPRLIVLDTTQLIVREPVQKIAFLHYLTDNMPAFSRFRFGMILDFVRIMKYSPDEAMGLLVPITLYHSEWEGMQSLIPAADPKRYTAGAKVTAKVLTDVKVHEKHEADENAVFGELAVNTLRDILEMCRNSGTDICLISIPLQSVSQEGYIRRTDAAYFAKRLADEYGINMFNCIDRAEEMGFDISHDSTDGFHMNVFGSERYTTALGYFLRENYSLPDRRTDGSHTFMQDMEEEWRKEKERRILATAAGAAGADAQ